MARKFTQEEVIALFKSVHGDLYSYVKTIYKSMDKNIIATCKVHGDFSQKAGSHAKGYGCRACGHARRGDAIRITKEQVLEKANIVHGDKYVDYDFSEFWGITSYINIKCRDHGWFKQKVDIHLNGCGCPKCLGRGRTTSEFLEKALSHEKHLGKNYDVSKVKFIKNSEKITVGCELHGYFVLKAERFLHGAGCPKCTGRYKTKDELIEQIRLVNKNFDKLNFDKTVYKLSKSPMTVTCIDHGDFITTADNLLAGCGCPICGRVRANDSKRMSGEEFVKNALLVTEHIGRNYKYFPEDYAGYHIPTKIECEKHGVFYQTPANHIYGFGCTRCGRNDYSEKRSKTQKEFLKEIMPILLENNYGWDLMEYKHNLIPIKLHCKKHGYFKIKPGKLLAGARCQTCSKQAQSSAAEKEVCKLVKELGFDYEPTKKFDGRFYTYDCVIDELKIAIEYNGCWHHRYEKYNDENYHVDKREHCETNGYRMVTIWENDWNKRKDTEKDKLKNILFSKEVYDFTSPIVNIDLDYQSINSYLNEGYVLVDIKPEKQKRDGHVVFNSGIATLIKPQ